MVAAQARAGAGADAGNVLMGVEVQAHRVLSTGAGRRRLLRLRHLDRAKRKLRRKRGLAVLAALLGPLHGIRERVDASGGVLEIVRQPAFALTVRLPLPNGPA